MQTISYNMIDRLFLDNTMITINKQQGMSMAWTTCCSTWETKEDWNKGCRAGLWSGWGNRPPLPSVILVNVHSLDDKVDELRGRVTFQSGTKSCNIIVLTETWLGRSTADSATVPEGLSIHRQDPTIVSSKSKMGGVCFIFMAFSPNLEQLMIRCRPYYQVGRSGITFTSVVLTVVYAPPLFNASQALDKLYGVVKRNETSLPEAAFIVARDFNGTNLWKVLPRYHQHIRW